MARIMVQMRIDKVETREHNGKTYASAKELAPLYDADGVEQSVQVTEVGLDLGAVGAVQKVQGRTVWLAVERVMAFGGGNGRRPFARMVGGQLVEQPKAATA